MFRLIAMLLATLALVACGAQPTQPAQTIKPARIDAVTVTVRESDPVQPVAHITGELGDGCMSLGEITQTRDGNVIEINVPAIRVQADACTMIMQMIDQQVALEGAFEPGVYTVRVNGVETTFSI